MLQSICTVIRQLWSADSLNRRLRRAQSPCSELLLLLYIHWLLRAVAREEIVFFTTELYIYLYCPCMCICKLTHGVMPWWEAAQPVDVLFFPFLLICSSYSWRRVNSAWFLHFFFFCLRLRLFSHAAVVQDYGWQQLVDHAWAWLASHHHANKIKYTFPKPHIRTDMFFSTVN